VPGQSVIGRCAGNHDDAGWVAVLQATLRRSVSGMLPSILRGTSSITKSVTTLAGSVAASVAKKDMNMSAIGIKNPRTTSARQIYMCGLALLLALSSAPWLPIASAQTSSSGRAKQTTSKTSKSTGNTSATSGTVQKPANSQGGLSDFQGQLLSVVESSTHELGDYIPCEFTLEQLAQLRPKPPVIVLGSSEAESLKSKVISEAYSQSDTPEFPKEARITFINWVAVSSFIGLTPSEALAKVIDLLDQAIKDAELQKKKGESLGTSSSATSRSNELPAAQPGPPEVALGGTLGVAQAGTQTEAILNSARNAISAFQRPPDIGCAMAIMGWNELRYAFGQTIADEYIGVQIVVRNVNPDREFLIHDAEISVDSDLNGRYGRFYSGQDKLVVRGFMLASRDYGRRNFIVHLAQGIGTVMSAASLVYGPALQSATNVFNAGFVTALEHVWSDHNTEQLNLLNDVGFSASKTDRTVVPKSGTAMFVIFISSKQFQDGWWVQDCANKIVLTPAPAEAEAPPSKPPIQPAQKVGGGSLQSGIDLDSLRAICLKESMARDTSGEVSGEDGQSRNQSTSAGVQYMNPKAVPYKNWSPRATAIFHELTLAVVAGTHFIPDTANVPSLLAISCPKDELGNIDFSKAAGGSITCDVTGQALDKAAKLKLRNAEKPVDPQTADGGVSTSGDSTKGTAKFLVADLGSLPAQSYKVYTVTKDGVESGGTQIVHLSSAPFLTDDPARPALQLDQLSAKAAAAATINLKGYHLDKLTSIHLGNSATAVAAGDSISIDAPVNGSPSATAASFDVTPVQVAKLPPGDYTAADKHLKMYIFLVSKDAPGTKVPTGQILSGTGILGAAAAAPAEAAPKKPAAKPAPAAKPGKAVPTPPVGAKK